MRSNLSRFVVSGLILLVVGGGMLWGLSFALFAFSPLHQNTPGSPAALIASEGAIIEVRKGQSTSEITKSLAASGILSGPDEARKFNWLGRLTRQWKKIKAGEYKVLPSMSPLQVFGVLTSGISIVHPVTIREGENMYEIGMDLESKKLSTKDRFLALCRDPKFIGPLFKEKQPETLEGYLFPDTYFFNRTMSGEEMIRQMVRRFWTAWGEKEMARAQEMGFSRHQVITLASIIEKETGAAQERPLISSVFHNRLKKRMKLQSDPTTIYGIWESYKGNIRKSDLMAENEYNTYHVPALPKGPISNPGRESIQAALFPVASEFLFFVSHNDGTHQFSRNFSEHNNAVKKFQVDPKARQNKSWRDLRKNQDSRR